MFLDKQFEIQGVSVTSGVSDQPKSDAETIEGATNRASNAQREHGGADFYVGIEGGVEQKGSDMEAFAWVIVLSKEGKIGRGRTGTFFLPHEVCKLIQQGKELGEADDIVFGRTNSKQENGAVGLLTDNVIDRAKYYSIAVVLALIPFKNTNLY